MKIQLGILAIGVGMSVGTSTIANAQQPQYDAPMPPMGQAMGQAMGQPGGMMNNPQMQAQMQAQMTQMRQGCERMMATTSDRMRQPNRR